MTTFSIDIDRWVKKAEGRTDTIVRKVTLDMFRRVILRTPVDTGRARANWQASIGQPITGSSLIGTDKKGGATVAAAGQIVAQAKGGDQIFLANNVVYIVPLEHGHSKQAPAGMVGITVQEFGAAVDNATKD